MHFPDILGHWISRIDRIRRRMYASIVWNRWLIIIVCCNHREDQCTLIMWVKRNDGIEIARIATFEFFPICRHRPIKSIRIRHKRRQLIHWNMWNGSGLVRPTKAIKICYRLESKSQPMRIGQVHPFMSCHMHSSCFGFISCAFRTFKLRKFLWDRRSVRVLLERCTGRIGMVRSLWKF